MKLSKFQIQSPSPYPYRLGFTAGALGVAQCHSLAGFEAEIEFMGYGSEGSACREPVVSGSTVVTGPNGAGIPAARGDSDRQPDRDPG
jgi:hypothetical protein